MAYKNKELGRIKERERYNNNPEFYRERIKNYHKTPNGRFTYYRRWAKERNLDFKISLKEFMLFWKKDCGYCGDKIGMIGLDRINNKKGYELKNLISCCYKCNWMKNNLTREEFINHCIKIIKNNV